MHGTLYEYICFLFPIIVKGYKIEIKVGGVTVFYLVKPFKMHDVIFSLLQFTFGIKIMCIQLHSAMMFHVQF